MAPPRGKNTQLKKSKKQSGNIYMSDGIDLRYKKPNKKPYQNDIKIHLKIPPKWFYSCFLMFIHIF